jgi:hypothetical protein
LLRLRGFSPKTRSNALLTSGVQNVKTITKYLYISFEQVLQCSFYNSVMYYNLQGYLFSVVQRNWYLAPF